MFGCKCFHWSRIDHLSPSEPYSFSLPAPLLNWPPGDGFATGTINLGEIQVFKISRFDFILSFNLSADKAKGVTFYKPAEIPDGYYSLGHCCHPNDKPLKVFSLVAKESSFPNRPPAIRKPLDYKLVWSLNDGDIVNNYEGYGFFWLPQPPEGYMVMGYLVTRTADKPDLDEVRCVRVDLTDKCEAHCSFLKLKSKLSSFPFQVGCTRPLHRGIHGRGVSVGTFCCCSDWGSEEELSIACLKNFDSSLQSMPNIDQIRALVNHYGPTVFFHPDEVYLPSSVSWFFETGAILYKNADLISESIDANGSNLPCGGKNDGEFWIDLPSDDRKKDIIHGNLQSAKLYVHVKPAAGGTFTDIVMWVFCPFNGPVTLKVGVMNIAMSKLGQHVCDWEHFTLRICNFTGELSSIYFSQHSGGEWVDPHDLEYIEGNKAIVYSSKSGHASYPHQGTYIQGSSKFGFGIRNDAARSNLYVDSSICYEIVAAEYLGQETVKEPHWLQFMREWGPTIIYDSKRELDKILNRLPAMMRYSMENVFSKFPVELYGEEGPTGPKEKNNWIGDERG